jgi:hypothetical protein
LLLLGGGALLAKIAKSDYWLLHVSACLYVCIEQLASN